MVQKIDISPDVYNQAYTPHLNNQTRTQIYFGGSSSGKSVFLAQRCIVDLLKGERNYLICRAVQRTIRSSVYNELNKLIKAWGLTEHFRVNKSEMTITCSNGYQILFSGLDDVEKVKSVTPELGVITDIWIEEATETNKDSVKQLYKRLRGKSSKAKRVTLSFNPILLTSWIYTEYFEGWTDNQTELERDGLHILKTTYKDNDFLEPDDIKALEDEKDSYFYNVYTLGNWGTLGDVIFTNWSIKDLSKHSFESFNNGLDFGFAADPAAVIHTHREAAKKKIYILDEAWEKGLTNDILAEEVIKLIDRDYVFCDCAEPKSIAELKQYKVNALPTMKGKDSLNHSIQWLQQHEIIVDEKCVKTIAELQQYQWQKDKDGNSIKKPVDKYNHLIDALRYAYNREWKQMLVETIENPFYD